MARGHHFDVGLHNNIANYTPLLACTAYVYRHRPAVIHVHGCGLQIKPKAENAQ
jgi:hypothetical protein